jgi:hypothetical protein
MTDTDPPNGTPVRSDDLRRTSYHESGHALAGWLYDRPLAIVSIRPGQFYTGVTRWESADRGWVDSFDPGLPALLEPTNVRKAIEREIVISLAGPIAGSLAVITTGYYEPAACEVEAEREAAGLAALTPRAQELVVALEGEPGGVQDEESARHLSHALTWDDNEAAMHLAWLRVTARNLVISRWYRVAALADVLLERRVLDGDSAVQILSSAQRGASNA